MRRVVDAVEYTMGAVAAALLVAYCWIGIALMSGNVRIIAFIQGLLP